MATTKANEARASVKHVRMTPNKMRFMLDQIRGKSVAEAERILAFSPRAASAELGKVLHAAVSNAQLVLNAEPEDLVVSRCWADEGITLKRFMPRAQGRAYRIRKRTSHITICVAPEKEGRS
jgi:large subunit ribosomal protein L22